MTRADTTPITVLLADDQRLVRAGLRAILDSEPDITVVGEADNGVRAVELAASLVPTIALLDIRMPIMDGLEAARRVLAGGPVRVLMLTTFDADEYIYQALRAGASGFLLKDAPPDQLLAAVRCIAAGDALIDPAITRRLIRAFTAAVKPAGQVPARLAALTARELAVLQLMARGLSNLEIARDLVVEESTVKSHVAHILAKLDIRDRVQAVILAYETGFVPLPQSRLDQGE